MPIIQKTQSEEENNFFSEMLNKYKPFWPLFLSLFVGFMILTLIYLHYAVPKYEITATILVKDEKKGVDDSNLMEQLDLFGEKKLVENEIQVIYSRSIMKAVIKNLNLCAPITYEGKVVERSGYMYSPVIVNLKNPDSLIEVDQVYFKYDSASQKVIMDNHAYALDTWIHKDSVGDFRFLPNPNYRRPKIEKPLYFSTVNIKDVTDDLMYILKVTQATKLSSVIGLDYTDPIPKRGEDILNNIILEYNKSSLADKNALASSTLRFVNERLRLVATELDSVEQGIETYKTKEGIVDISAQGEQYLESVSANDQKISEINVQLSVMDEIEKYVKSKNNTAGIVPATLGVADPVLIGLLSKLSDMEVQYEGLRKTTAENNPILLAAQDQIDKIKPGILENVASQRRNLKASLDNLTGNSDRYSSILSRIPKKEKKLVEISRQQGIKNAIYTFLLQKREETALTYESTIADTRILDPADTGSKPVSPKKILVFLAAIVLSFGTGAAVIAFRESFNSHILFRSEIENYTNVPIVGEISYVGGEEALVIGEGRRTVIAEQFRQLRTSLAYIGISNRKKKLLITSTMSGEGKSFITANLGVSLALTDKKVVLLELDLRKPKLSKLFGVGREVGLSNYFIGNKEAQEIIKPTDANPNLFIIPCGAIPPNPSELILNGRLEVLLAYLETKFDYIIIDTAPVTPVTDAYILSPFCDATLYIVRHGVTQKHSIKFLDKNMQVKGLKNLAMVFNGVKSRGITRYDYGYGYGNANGYSYMETEKKPTILDKVFRKRSKSVSEKE